ncbi:MAG TPA: hypothetical protein VII37_01100 [Candidatus Acidoferrum sp.]|jgi:hypothetical protein
MVLSKEELISSLKNEVRLLLHLAGKIDKAKLNYRPTPRQRSTLELLQYMAIMAPTQVVAIKGGDFSRPTMMAIWGPAESASKAMNFEQTIAAIEQQGAQFDEVFSGWTEADFRNELELFGQKSSRGAMLVNLVLGGFAAYRMQLFCYLKSCGREELNTVNLWMGADSFTAP